MSLGHRLVRWLAPASAGLAAALLAVTTLAGCSGGGGGGGGGGSAAPVPGSPIITPISANGHDRLFGVVFDGSGNVFAVGVVSDSTASTDDFATIVVKFKPDGTLDSNFGMGGFARVNLAAGGTNAEVARGIVLQSNGKIVVSATIENPRPDRVRGAGHL